MISANQKHRVLIFLSLLMLVVLGVTLSTSTLLSVARNDLYVSFSKILIKRHPQSGTEGWELIERDQYPVSTLGLSSTISLYLNKPLIRLLISSGEANLHVQYLLGYANLLEGNTQSAITHLSSTEERKVLTSLLLGVAFEREGKHDQAVHTWRQVSGIEQYFLRIGSRSLYGNGDLRLALSNFLIASEIAPQLCEPLYRKGLALDRLGRRAEAFAAWSIAERSDCPDKGYLGELLYIYGKTLIELGEHDRAIEKLRKAVSLDPGDSKRLLVLGYELADDINTRESARSLFTQALSVEPKEPEVYIALCRLELQQAHYEEALAWCGQAVQLFPNNARAYHYMGLVYYAMDDYDSAIAYLHKSVENDPHNVNTWIRLGQAYAADGNIDMAFRAYDEGSKIDPDNPRIQALMNELPDSK